MATQQPSGFNAEKLRNFPARDTLIPALKVGALTGKAFSLLSSPLFSRDLETSTKN